MLPGTIDSLDMNENIDKARSKIIIIPLEDMASDWLSTENDMMIKLVSLDIFAPSPEILISKFMFGSVISNSFRVICIKDMPLSKFK